MAAMQLATPGDGTESGLGPASWHDRKRYLWLLGIAAAALPFGAYRLVERSGSDVFWFLGPIFVLLILPLLDLIVGPDSSNPPDSVLKWLEQDRYYRWVTYAFLPLQYLGLAFASWVWAEEDLSLVGNVGLAFSTGIVAGNAINVAHELGHKRVNLERWLSRIALAQSAYGHFYIEHNRGHHVRVATPEDPASARMGESFWAFLPRTVLGSLMSAWAMERERLGRLGKSPLSPQNDLLQAWAMTVVVFGVLTIVFGPIVLPFLLLQAAVGFTQLEVTNYVEHYGLLRQEREDGRYERCTPDHSWNSNRIVSNVFTFHLQRHSDHHANPTRRYQALRSDDGAPQLPTGYFGMYVLAYIPPLWRWVMDKRLLDFYGGDITRCNLTPGLKRRLRQGRKEAAA
jgi:alkane 1-monooxygenase